MASSTSDLILIPQVTPNMLAGGCRTVPMWLAAVAEPDPHTSPKLMNHFFRLDCLTPKKNQTFEIQKKYLVYE
jgi:hypothetical protein